LYNKVIRITGRAILVSPEELIEIQRQKLNEQTQTIGELRRTIDELNRIIDGLKQTISELTEKLGKNSRNSSKPPSSDGLNKPSPKSLRKPSGKKAGGQVGHPGAHLSIIDEPNETVRHMPLVCRGCPNHEICISRACVDETRHVIDAIVTVKVTAHQALQLDCPKHGMLRNGEFPEEVKALVQYGENLQALVVALNTVGAVSVNRTHEILSSVFNIPLSTGTVSNMVSRCANGLEWIAELIRDKTAASPIVHCDETGTRVDGKTMRVHSDFSPPLPMQSIPT
jgi:transposase